MIEPAISRPGPHVAASDCERIRQARVAQPVNTISSLAYCASGAWILSRGPRSRRRLALAAMAIAAGLGSVAYHGPGGRAGRLVHDVTAAALGGGIALALVRPSSSVARRSATVGCLAAAIAVHATSRTDRVLCRPDSLWQGHALWHVLGAAAVVMAAES